MSKKSSVRFLVALLFVTFTTAALVVADLGVLAQNANTTQDESMQNANANAGTTRRGRRGRRGRGAGHTRGGQCCVDLRVRQRHVLAHREGLAERNEADQPVLETPPLLRRRRAR